MSIVSTVTPCVGVWIETGLSGYIIKLPDVTPCVGVWIETTYKTKYHAQTMSHPAWVCGLKHIYPCLYGYSVKVTPCVGVWIETCLSSCGGTWNEVTPCVGVWIETRRGR